jgi:hypothetical protein
VFVEESKMPEQKMTEKLNHNPGAKSRVAVNSDCWEEYEKVLRYIRFLRQGTPTLRTLDLADHDWARGRRVSNLL